MGIVVLPGTRARHVLVCPALFTLEVAMKIRQFASKLLDILPEYCLMLVWSRESRRVL